MEFYGGGSRVEQIWRLLGGTNMEPVGWSTLETAGWKTLETVGWKTLEAVGWKFFGGGWVEIFLDAVGWSVPPNCLHCGDGRVESFWRHSGRQLWRRSGGKLCGGN